MTAYIYTPVVWEWRGLDESNLNLSSLTIEGYHIDNTSYQPEFEVGVLGNKFKNRNDNAIDSLVANVDVHN